MHYISKLLAVAAFMLVAQTADAQPPARKNNPQKEKKAAGRVVNTALSERAKSQYPGTVTPNEVEWKRDVYRVVDLNVEENASLYYPVEPIGESVNLFTFLFRNIMSGNIVAYAYNLNGYESFTEESIIDPKNMLEDYRIYYEEKDGEIIVGKNDVPSAEVLSYYIKESHYYDQRTGTYGTRITAIYPVLHRSDEFSSEVTKYPMFWLNYDEISPLLAQQSIMTSSLNNVSSMTLNDYFAKNAYKGEIYKTVNLRNLAIAQYCKDSAEVKKEQQKIEQQLKDFRTNIWSTKSVAEMRQDSINAASEAAKDSIGKAENPEKSEKKITRRERRSKEQKVKKSDKKREKKSESGNSKSTRVSVRRARR